MTKREYRYHNNRYYYDWLEDLRAAIVKHYNTFSDLGPIESMSTPVPEGDHFIYTVKFKGNDKEITQ